ncbi:MAG: TonB-dependent receptor plug domain-containing protein, partial [Tannerellaceae bacterium]
MKKKVLLCFGILPLTTLFSPTTIQANNPENEQTLITDSVRLSEVVVTGSMTEVSKRQLPLHVEVIGRKDIEQRKTTSLLPLLSERIPGMFVTQRGVMGFGVANGSAGSMTMRGIGGSPNTQLLVLIDG